MCSGVSINLQSITSEHSKLGIILCKRLGLGQLVNNVTDECSCVLTLISSTWKMIDFLLYYGLSEMRMKSPIQFNGMQTQIPGCSNFWFKIVNYWVIKWPSRPTTTPCNKQDWQCSCTLCGFEACNYIQQNVIRYSNNFNKCYDKKSF